MKNRNLGLQLQARLSFFLVLTAFAMTSCGVKGKPLAPLEPPPIGTGQPETAVKSDTKINTKTNIQKR